MEAEGALRIDVAVWRAGEVAQRKHLLHVNLAAFGTHDETGRLNPQGGSIVGGLENRQVHARLTAVVKLDGRVIVHALIDGLQKIERVARQVADSNLKVA